MAAAFAPIRSERLELVSVPPEWIEAVLVGERSLAFGVLDIEVPAEFPTDGERRWLSLRARQMRDDPAMQQWLVRALVLPHDGRPMIGHAGFHGPPGRNGLDRADAVEIGYTIFPAHRRRGYATEAARALIGWARDVGGIEHFVASAAPTNAASIAVLRKIGFVHTGRQWDEEDGEELVFQLPAPA
jgi:ribosomal-protein-alanine N-acetyltransferase